MTEIAALRSYFAGVAPIFPHDSVPDDVDYPYFTFDPVMGFFNDGDVPMQIQLWHRTASDAEINSIARELGRLIGYGGATVMCDSGWLWIKRGTPFMVPITTPDDDMVKRRLINVRVEFITA